MKPWRERTTFVATSTTAGSIRVGGESTGEAVAFAFVVTAESFVVVMRGVGQRLVVEQDAPAGLERPGDLGDIATESVVHRVDRPDGVDAPVDDRNRLGRAVHHLDGAATTADEPASTEDRAHIRRRLDRDNARAGRGRPHGSCAHSRADVDDALPGCGSTDSMTASFIAERHISGGHRRYRSSPRTLVVVVPVMMFVMVTVFVVRLRHARNLPARA